MARTFRLADPTRVLFAGLGWCAVALAAAGVVVPGLPTTVFVLAASYCFSRSSPRFARWLRTHPLFGSIVEVGSSAMEARRPQRSVALSGPCGRGLSSHPSFSRVRIRWGALVTFGLGAVGTLSILFAVRTVPERADARLI